MLRCTLGARTDHPVGIQVVAHPDDFDLEDVFWACNRILPLEEDVKRLDAFWMRTLRVALSEYRAPSMSPGDQIEHWVIDAHGLHIAQVWEVEDLGFRPLLPEGR
jgi:hypothetical protein